MAVSTTNPWSAGAVVFDQRPFLAFYERQAARQQAKEDALDNYFRDLGKNVTSAGMRSQDVPVLLQKNKEWQNFYGQNKAAILNPKLDNGKAYSEYMNRYQDQLGAINESKGALKSMDEIGKMKLNPQMSYVFDDPNFMNEIQQHELPIGDPNRKGINLATISLPTKPLETKDWEAYNKYLTGGIPHDKIPGATENIGGFKTRTPVYTQFNPEQQLRIGEHAMNAYDTDKRWRMEAVKEFKELQNDPVRFEQLNKVYKSLYGGDIDNPKEAWVAKGIFDNNMKATEYKEGKDDLGREMYLMKIRQANAKDLIKYKKEIDPEDKDMNNVWYQSYLDNVINDAKQSGERRNYYESGGKSIAYYNVINPDPFLMKSFARGGSEPERLGITDDGKIIPIFYKYTKDGVVKHTEGPDKGRPQVDMDMSRPMTYDQALVNMGYRGRTKKQLGEDFNKGIPNRSYKIDGKLYTRKQLNDMGYDDKEIEDYLKQGLIK